MTDKEHFLTGMATARGRSNDVFYTPEDLAQEIIAMCPLEEGDMVLDPWAGEDVFYDNYPSFVTKEWCEITRGRDWNDHEGEVDWIISNPPYSKFKEIFEKLPTKCRKGVCLIMGGHSLTRKRVEVMEEAGFYITYLELFLVKKWGGFTQIVVLFEKGKPECRKLSKWQY
jgi:hypothetical protein